MFSRLATSFFLAKPAQLFVALPKRPLIVMFNKHTRLVPFFKPSLMTFASSERNQAAADTPATHMHRTISLERSVLSFFERQTGRELSLASLTGFIEERLLRGPISF